MVREISPPQARYMVAPPPEAIRSRIPISSALKHSSSSIKTPSSRSISSSQATSRKRAVFGERNDTENIPPPSQSTFRVKSIKASTSASSKLRTPTFVTRIASSPASPSRSISARSSAASSPRSISAPRMRPPRDPLSMSTMAFPDANMSQLLDMEAPSLIGLSSPVSSVANDATPRATSRSRIGPGRMMTPEYSQETLTRPETDLTTVIQTSHRLPTPPASQTSDEVPMPAALRSSKVRPRPAPTPPRRSVQPVQADTTPDPSPNPRKKKSPRTMDAAPSPSRPSMRSPYSGLADLSRLAGITSPPLPSTPQSAQTSHTIIERIIPATAPAKPRNTRKSLPANRKSVVATTTKAHSRQSLPARSRSRKSMSASIAALTGSPIGVLPQPIEITPGDDPLLLKAEDDDEWLAMRRLSRSQSMASSQGSQRTTRDASVSMSQRSVPSGPSRLRQVTNFDDIGAPASSPRSERPPTREPSTPRRSPASASSPAVTSRTERQTSPIASAAEISTPEESLPALGADSGDYDIPYDVAPGWMSDDSTDVEEEGEINKENVDAWDEPADDTFLNVASRERRSSPPPALLTPSRVSELVNVPSTTPCISPPSRTAVVHRAVEVLNVLPSNNNASQSHVDELPFDLNALIEEITQAAIVQTPSRPKLASATAPRTKHSAIRAAVSTTPAHSPIFRALENMSEDEVIPVASEEQSFASTITEIASADTEQKALEEPVDELNLEEIQEIEQEAPFDSLVPTGAREDAMDSKDISPPIDIASTDSLYSQDRGDDVASVQDDDALIEGETRSDLDGDVTREAISEEWHVSLDIATPALSDEEAPAIESPDCRSPEAHCLPIFSSPIQPTNDEQIVYEGESKGDLRDVSCEEIGQLGAAETVQQLESTSQAVADDSFNDDSLDIASEADKVFERYISVPPSPSPKVDGDDKDEVREHVTDTTSSLLRVATPYRQRALSPLTPRRNLGSPYRMVISPGPAVNSQNTASFGSLYPLTVSKDQVIAGDDSAGTDEEVVTEFDKRDEIPPIRPEESMFSPVQQMAATPLNEQEHTVQEVTVEAATGEVVNPSVVVNANPISTHVEDDDSAQSEAELNGADTAVSESNLEGPPQKSPVQQQDTESANYVNEAVPDSQEEQIPAGDNEQSSTTEEPAAQEEGQEQPVQRESSRIVVKVVPRLVKYERPSDPSLIVANLDDEVGEGSEQLVTEFLPTSTSAAEAAAMPETSSREEYQRDSHVDSAILDHHDMFSIKEVASTTVSSSSSHHTAASAPQEQQALPSSDTTSDEGLSIGGVEQESHGHRTRPRRSLGDELATATAAEISFDEGNDSFRSVVEVSSLDPRAAARAAAILKLNHAYIEHGILPSASSTPAQKTIPLPTPSTPGTSFARTPRSGRRQKTYESRHFSSIDSARKLNREELLYEAELEIVQSRRSRSRSRARSVGAESTATGWESDETELAVPGGWKRTPGQKRKRSKSLHRSARPMIPDRAISPIAENEPEQMDKPSGRPWGVPEWKRLEKVFRSEKEAWMKEREIKPLPGFFGWAKKALTGQAEVKEWDNDRVVKRFIGQERAENLGGEWSEKLIALRVKALEKRVNAPRADILGATAKEEGRQGKKPRKEEKRMEKRSEEVIAATPRRGSVGDGDSTVVSIVPPSTIRRMLGYVWSRPSGDTSVIEEGDSISSEVAVEREEQVTQSDEGVFGETRQKAENKLLARLKGVKERHNPLTPVSSTPLPATPSPTASSCRSNLMGDGTPMRQISTPAHPSSPAWSTPPIPGAFRSAFNAPTKSLQSSASLSSAPISASPPITSSMPITPKIYPSLNPPMTQRSSALKALFDTPSRSSSGPSKALDIPTKKTGSPSVGDLVKSFEEEGTLARHFELGKGKGRLEELKRSHSRG